MFSIQFMVHLRIHCIYLVTRKRPTKPEPDTGKGHVTAIWREYYVVFTTKDISRVEDGNKATLLPTK